MFSPLDASRQLAALRAAERQCAEPRFLDPFAEALAAGAAAAASPSDRDADAAATAYLDEQLLRGVDIVNMDIRQEYRQVVLLGCGMDTRPFRLGWPVGTVLFLLAPQDVHDAGEQVLRAAGATVTRGCLLRRVPIDLQGEAGDFGVALEAAGYRGDRLSIWGVQGLARLGLRPRQVSSLLAHAANMAALYSLFVGQLPPATEAQAAEWLAQAGLLGSLLPLHGLNAEPAGGGLSQQLTGAGALNGSGGDSSGHADSSHGSRQRDGQLAGAGELVVPRLFSAQQQRISLAQMRVYNSHVLAGQEADEDFEGNFS